MVRPALSLCSLSHYAMPLADVVPKLSKSCEIKRRTEVVGIFPNEDATTRPVSAILLEQNDERAVQRRSLHDTGNDRLVRR